MATAGEPVLEVERSQSFTDDLLHNLCDMRSRGEMTDFSIKVNNVSILCHSAVMAAASPFFKRLLHCPMKEAAKKEVDLNSCNEVYLQRIVDYCYTGRINIELSASDVCLDIAEYLQLSSLKDDINIFIEKHLTPEICIGWYFRAEKYQLDTLKTRCMTLMTEAFPDVVKHSEFHQLTLRELIDYIGQMGASINSDILLDASVSWASYNVEARSDGFLDILSHIRLDLCSKSCLERVLQSWKPVWPNSTDVHQQLREAISKLTLMPVKQPAAAAVRAQLKILFVGGCSENNALNRNCWLLDPVSYKCKQIGNMAPTAVKYRAVYCSSKEGIFVIGGSRALHNLTPTKECSLLNSKTFKCAYWPGSWQPLASATAICIGDEIYVFGGEPASDHVWCLDLGMQMWYGCPDMPVKNVFPIVAAVSDKAYFVFHTAPINESFKATHEIPMYCFDITSHMWSGLKPLPSAIKNTRGAAAVVVGDELFLVGGWAKVCAKYSPRNDSWSLLQRPRFVHRAFSAVHMDGKILVCGGYDEMETCHNSIEVYDIARNEWKVRRMNMPVSLQGHHCAVYDDVTKELVTM